MGWVTWVLLALAVGTGILILGLAVGLLMLLIPPKIFSHECVCCGRWGHWTQRTSLGYHKCDVCAALGPHKHDYVPVVDSDGDVIHVQDPQERL